MPPNNKHHQHRRQEDETSSPTISFPWPKRQRAVASTADSTCTSPLVDAGVPSSSSSINNNKRVTKFRSVLDQSRLNGLVCFLSDSFGPQNRKEEGVAAARRIQRVWRFRFSPIRTNVLAAGFLDPRTGIPIEHVKSISFEALNLLLRTKPIIQMTKNLLLRIHLLCRSLHVETSYSEFNLINTRIFLVVFMVAYFPERAFESIDANTPARFLYEAGLRLSDMFERILRCLVESGSISRVPSELTRNFIPALLNYIRCFNAWKGPDEIKLQKRLIHALVALEDSLAVMVREDDPAATNTVMMITEFNDAIAKLRCRLANVGGNKALDEYDEGRKEGRSSSSSNSTSSSSRTSNEQLAHELLLDSNFRLNKRASFDTDLNSVNETILNQTKRAYWNSLLDDLQIVPPCYVRVVNLLDEIRKGVVEIAAKSQQQSDVDEINTVIDIPLIKQQLLEFGAFDNWDSFTRLVFSIVSVIRRLHHHYHTAQSAASKAETDTMHGALDLENGSDCESVRPQLLCNALEFLYGRLNVLRIESANKCLSNISPAIKLYGIAYEQGKFEEKLMNGSITLEKTEKWIVAAVSRCETGLRSDLVKGNGYRSLYLSAVVPLVANSSSSACVDEMVPETLLLDKGRLLHFHAEFNSIVDRSVALTFVTHVVIGSELQKRKALSRLSSYLVTTTSDVKFSLDQVFGELGDAFDAVGLYCDPVERTGVFDTVKKVMEKDKDVRRLISDRIRAAWTNRLISSTPIESARLTPATRAFIPRLESGAAMMIVFTNVNLAVHTAIYNHLIATAVAEQKNIT